LDCLTFIAYQIAVTEYANWGVARLGGKQFGEIAILSAHGSTLVKTSLG
jgi:hypothetical protein